MAQITLAGNPIHTSGELPASGMQIKNFTLADGDLNDITLESFGGKQKILNIVPSLDTSICATSARKFNERAAAFGNAVVLVISMDLPFAQKRFCEVEGLKNVTALSAFRSKFPEEFGVRIIDGPLKGLTARAVVVLDENNAVIHRQLVPEIKQEPDYDAALASLKK